VRPAKFCALLLKRVPRFGVVSEFFFNFFRAAQNASPARCKLATPASHKLYFVDLFVDSERLRKKNPI
jgi:hypothetical protein